MASLTPCPGFEEECLVSKDGKWKITPIKNAKSTTYKIFYDGKPISVNVPGILSGSFDINEYKGEPIKACSLKCSTNCPTGIVQPTSERMRSALAPVKKAVAMAQEALRMVLSSNDACLGPIQSCFKTANNGVDDAFVLNMWSDCYKSDVRKSTIETIITINRKDYKRLTRGQLMDAIRGKYFAVSAPSEITAYYSEAKRQVYMKLEVKKVTLLGLVFDDRVDEEEQRRMEQESAMMLESLMGTGSDE